jgi:N-acetyl sugar amidotransferase
MRYCVRCLYPENAKPTIIFDDDGLCSGCKIHESKVNIINWAEREVAFRNLLEKYKAEAKVRGTLHDCIIPVSGGKDSHYQVYLAKVVYGMNPLLVTYNHAYNTQAGIRNINNIVKQFDCDIIRYTTPPGTARAISRHMLKKVGDITWHYHTGIFTFPFQVAVKWNIPLVLWGEHGFAEMTGMFRLEDMPEFTAWSRQEYEMRGIKLSDVVEDPEAELSWRQVAPLVFPDDELMDEVDVRGIYMGVYLPWEHLKITKFLVENYDFGMVSGRRDRTFSLFHKIDDHANDFHDYLKYLKFGYGRGTDHSVWEIRQGRMSREQGIEMARQYDSVEPKNLDAYLKFLGISRDDLDKIVEPMRDEKIWNKSSSGTWSVTDSVMNHANVPNLEKYRLELLHEDDQTFGKNNRGYFYTDQYPNAPKVSNQYVMADDENDFIIM